MLTASEKRWLETRTLENFSYCFEWCKLYRTVDCKVKRSLFLCPTQCSPNAIEDALDFSERVAVKLATDENCGVDEDCPPDMPFGWGRLKAARLAVEEEMDGTD